MTSRSKEDQRREDDVATEFVAWLMEDVTSWTLLEMLRDRFKNRDKIRKEFEDKLNAARESTELTRFPEET